MRALALLVGLLGAAAAAEVPPLSLRAEFGVAAPLSEAQAAVFASGLSATLTSALAVHPAVDVELALTSAAVARHLSYEGTYPGALAAVLVGARLRRPGAQVLLRPVLAAHAGLGWSGALHLALAVSAGVQARPTERFPLWLGLVLRVDALTLPFSPPAAATHDPVLGALHLTVEWQAPSSSGERT